VAEIRHFAIKKKFCSNMAKETFLKNFLENRHILRKKVMKLSRVFRGFGQIFSFLP
jgi:hypothetical protein